MVIKGLEGLTRDEIERELANGARFVVYRYCISVLVLTIQRTSAIYFVRAGESASAKGWPYTLTSLLLGWWGIPFGLIFTPIALFTNLRGGKDVTADVLSTAASLPGAGAANAR
ncbi:MAG: hypothetical protein ACYS9X_28085 [Planctomycetota bacterium]